MTDRTEHSHQAPNREHSDTVRVQVQDLRLGDRLWPTMRTVTMQPYRCATCRHGKSKLGLDGKDVIWGTYTHVDVVYPRPSEVKVYTNGPIPTRDVAGEWDRRDEEGCE